MRTLQKHGELYLRISQEIQRLHHGSDNERHRFRDLLHQRGTKIDDEIRQNIYEIPI